MINEQAGPVTAEKLFDTFHPRVRGQLHMASLGSQEYWDEMAEKLNSALAPLLAAEIVAAQVEMRERCARGCELTAEANYTGAVDTPDDYARRCLETTAKGIRALSISGASELEGLVEFALHRGFSEGIFQYPASVLRSRADDVIREWVERRAQEKESSASMGSAMPARNAGCANAKMIASWMRGAGNAERKGRGR